MKHSLAPTYRVDERTVFSLLSTKDAPELFATVDRSREALREWLPWVDHARAQRDTQAFIDVVRREAAGRCAWHYCIRHLGRVVGVISLNRYWPAEGRATIAYWLAPEYQGRGVVTACARCLIDSAVEQLDLRRIEIWVAENNWRSRAVAKRLGFQVDRTMPPPAAHGEAPFVAYLITREEWHQSQQMAPKRCA